ncbi:hypothetical protein VP01_2625g4 [Puccinia sorghi]|uniref:Uncharacterized protein n=1 Tax=Puccinia sorghi TaxID=27349 RepID=A0A0L6V684_9BASI|nr:hypothetical protein VP01_2625g4 [Puccinia sorghi]
MYTQFKALLPAQSSIVVQADPAYSVMYNWEWCFNDPRHRLHTCFAWLGHGSFVTKSAVNQFITLLSEQSVPSDSIALADNFFTTSMNRQPHVIVAPQIIDLPLSDRGFSDGPAGLERNRVYIERGVELLWKLLKAGQSAAVSADRDDAGTYGGTIRAADRADRLFMMTNIEAFPSRLEPRFEGFFNGGLAGWEDQLGSTGYTLGHLRGRALASPAKPHWAAREHEAIRSSYAAAIDGNNSTFWISPGPVKRNDWVGLGWIDRPMMSDMTRNILEVHFIVSNPEVFERGTVVEHLKTEGAESSPAKWERLREGDGTVGLDGQLGEEGFLQCFALNPPSAISNNNNLHNLHPQKFDCFVRFLDPTSLRHSLAIRVRSLVDHPVDSDRSPPLDSTRWWVWETFVQAL